MLSFTPRTSGALLGCFTCALLLALQQGASAAVFAARAQWTPSLDDESVTGYRVYVRPVGGTYGAPLDAGKPAPAANGTLALTVNDLDVGTDHVFVVTAYTASGLESMFSNETALGYAAVAPFVDSDGDGLSDAAEDRNLNRLLDPGETSRYDPDTDGDGVTDDRDACQGSAPGAAADTTGCTCGQLVCGDDDFCTTKSCDATGHCVLESNTNPCSDDGNPCTLDVCAGGGCTHPLHPDGTACTTPCTTAGQCSAGTCVVDAAEVTAGADLGLTVRRLVLRPAARGSTRLAVRGWLDSAVPIEPDRDGVTIEVDDGAGNALYATTVPPEAFTARTDRTRFVYAAGALRPTPYAGLRSLTVNTAGAYTKLLAVAVLPASTTTSWLPQRHSKPAPKASSALPGSQKTTLSLTIRSGTRCATDPMTCSGSTGKRCR